MEIHKLLKRQLIKAQINSNVLPDSLENWQEFISRINKTYLENDMERYLLERSMDISSREMRDLNEKLEHAQQTAGLGYWHYNKNTERMVWSKELLKILNLNPLEPPPAYRDFIQLIHIDERLQLDKLVEKALREHTNYRVEARIKIDSDHYKWFRIIGHCQKEHNQLSGIIIDINKDKEIEGQIKKLNQQLLITARRAGMSQIATSILHNIGNILNSSNVSLNILKESFGQPYYTKLFKVITMIKDNLTELPDFLTNDERGKLIPPYLIALGELIEAEHEKNNQEMDNIAGDIQQINNIVAMQQTIGGVSGIPETIFIPDVLETALQMSLDLSEEKSIEIIKDYVNCPLVSTDKSKLLQILVNLIQNAKDSVLKSAKEKAKNIKLAVHVHEKKQIKIEVIDNGIGIALENLDKIFSFGFTTKETGHGFGLHSCALSAAELGGSLNVKSQGIGKGATFFLTIPVKNDKEKGVIDE